jgi:RimJ/RimL family protein N-acetyltransferase
VQTKTGIPTQDRTCDAWAVIADLLPIETSRLRLRFFVPEDVAAVHAIESRDDVTRWLYWGPRSEEEVRAVLERKIARARDAPETGVAFAVLLKASDELIGYADVSPGPPEHRQGEIGFVFHPDHQGQGYATEAAEALLALAFGAYDLHRVEARAEARNVASVRVLEKLGLRREGQLVENERVKGEWQSEVVYGLLAREWRARNG